MDEIYGFFHVGVNEKIPLHTANIVDEILQAVETSGLREATQEIYTCVVGPDIEEINQLLKKSKITVIKRNTNRFLYEFPTIDYLLGFCKNRKNNCKIWYAHTKGSFNIPRQHQRKGLIEANLLGWENCSKLLDTFQICGARYRNTKGHGKHFAGNFWWANTDFVATLHPPDRKSRFYAENWICKTATHVGKIHRPVLPTDYE